MNFNHYFYDYICCQNVGVFDSPSPTPHFPPPSSYSGLWELILKVLLIGNNEGMAGYSDAVVLFCILDTTFLIYSIMDVQSHDTFKRWKMHVVAMRYVKASPTLRAEVEPSMSNVH